MRLKKCKTCGKNFETDKQGAYLCPDCAATARRSSVIRQRVCRTCGAEFPGGPRAWYCPACRADRSRENTRRYRRDGCNRKIGSTDICSVCGKEYIVEGSRQKYCRDCSDKTTAEQARARSREYNAENKDALYAHKETMRSNNKVCVVCGKVFDNGLPTVTCSEECANIWRRLRYAKTDQKRRGNK